MPDVILEVRMVPWWLKLAAFLLVSAFAAFLLIMLLTYGYLAIKPAVDSAVNPICAGLAGLVLILGFAFSVLNKR